MALVETDPEVLRRRVTDLEEELDQAKTEVRERQGTWTRSRLGFRRFLFGPIADCLCVEVVRCSMLVFSACTDFLLQRRLSSLTTERTGNHADDHMGAPQQGT